MYDNYATLATSGGTRSTFSSSVRLGYRWGLLLSWEIFILSLLSDDMYRVRRRMELLVLFSTVTPSIVMLRGRSILFQVATRMRNPLICPAVRYSIRDKRDPDLSCALCVTCLYFHITILYAYFQLLFLKIMFVPKTKRKLQSKYHLSVIGVTLTNN